MSTVSGACRIAAHFAPLRKAIPTLLLLFQESALLAQGTGTSPWVMAVDELANTFTGPLAKGLSLIAIVVGGLMFAYGEGGSKRALAGTVFGLGMALGAANFMKWLFGV